MREFYYAVSYLYMGREYRMSNEESVIWDLKEIKSKDPEVKWTAVNNLSKYQKFYCLVINAG